MKRIWFKPDCVRWIRDGKKTTTFRKTKHNGTYEVVKGPWYNATPIGLTLRLIPIEELTFKMIIWKHFETEGDFLSPYEFIDWLKAFRLLYPDKQLGWLHRIEVVEDNHQ